MSPTRAARHGLTLGWRSLLKLRHSPDQLLDVLLLPITFVLVFVFLFGKAVAGDWRAYLQFVLPGIAVQALMFASMGTALALNADLRTGIFDRLRSLPIARSSPLTGHLLGDLAKDVVSLVLVFAFAVCWVAALVGMLARSPGSVQGLAFLLIFPLTFGSNVVVPTASLPGWLQAWVRINPVTQVSDAARGLILDLPPGRSVAASLLWTAGILVVFAPLAVRAYRRQA
jgi:oleandomycin transport system permease protein